MPCLPEEGNVHQKTDVNIKSSSAFFTNVCYGNQSVDQPGLPLIMYAPRRGGGFKSPIHFHCVLHANWGWVGPDSMYDWVRTKWKAPLVF